MTIFRKKYQKTKNYSLKAFTLIEVLIYMALFVGFLMILSALFISILDTQLTSSTTAQIDQDSWYVLRRMHYDFYRADSIELPVNNGEESNVLTLNIAGNQITYLLNNNKLSINENGITYSLLNQDTNASNLSFKKLGNEDGSATITVYVQLKNLASAKTKTLNFTLGLR